VLEKFRESLGVRPARQRFVHDLQLEIGPAGKAVLACKRLLDFAKPGGCVGLRQHLLHRARAAGSPARMH
jgi:hypothetical protein